MQISKYFSGAYQRTLGNGVLVARCLRTAPQVKWIVAGGLVAGVNMFNECARFAATAQPEKGRERNRNDNQ